ncbi:Retrovirus-related Pol polyprotein from transposon TNT 1-94-like protein [Drosera capensis]
MLHLERNSSHLTRQVTLKMGNDGASKVIGVGDVCLETNMGMKLLLIGVKHALDVRINLISVQMLDNIDYDNHFDSEKWKLFKCNLVMARGEKMSKLYCTKALIARNSVNVIDMDISSLWHRKLSHISKQGLNWLAKKDVLTGLKGVELEKCSHCMAKCHLDHLWVFGYKALVHFPKDERSKLDMKTRQCIFLGYAQDELGYQLYDPIEKTVVRSHNVVFMEDQTIDDIDKLEKTTPMKNNDRTDVSLVRLPVHNPDTTEVVEQMDMKTAFLHGDLEEEIYMEQLDGFRVKGKEDYVCKLKKSLYGLKQAPRQWYKKFELVICGQDYMKTTSDHCVFVNKFSDGNFIILLLYVDDMFIIGKYISRIDRLKKQLDESFVIKDMGPTK